ncbi:hypothetical protein [Puia dinghuensis]|uniref:hypothetical protein n=1 Tax=Puia dinghuensis TaxID=1792502 RepID=UPI001664E728|nr:hypothetical protein [Puia dinghuensis]
MNKAKIFLAATAILGLVGGALAFKAAKSGSSYCYTTALSSVTCSTFAHGSLSGRSGIKYVVTTGTDCLDRPMCSQTDAASIIAD